MIKSTNLISILAAKNSLDKPALHAYFKHFGIEAAINGNKSGIKESELDDIEKFCKKIEQNSTVNTKIFDGYYLGYHIPQIGKEFDLLRLGTEYLINIEIKSQADQHKVKEQLKKNKYYLSFLNKPMYLYSYIVDIDTIYLLDNNGELAVVNSFDIAEVIYRQNLDHIYDIDGLFKPSYYLVSPFNSTEKFVKGEYFLTNQQLEIKNEVLSSLNSSGCDFISVAGGAGTGKYIAPIEKCAKLRECQKGANDEHEETMDRQGKISDRPARVKRRPEHQRTLQRSRDYAGDVLQMARSVIERWSQAV